MYIRATNAFNALMLAVIDANTYIIMQSFEIV